MVGTNNDIPTVYNEISEIPHISQIILQLGETYTLEDGYKIQIEIDQFGRKRVIFTPGEIQHDR